VEIYFVRQWKLECITLCIVLFYSIKNAILTNFRYLFKDCHVAEFWTKVDVVHMDMHPHMLLVLPIELRI
jgi:hypothetical protein